MYKRQGKYNKEIVEFQKGIRKFLRLEEKEHFTEIRLKSDERERILQRINNDD